jgi:ribosomal protein L13
MIDKSEFITNLVKIVAKELHEMLPKEADELEYLKHTKVYIDSKLDHITQCISNKEA